MEETAAFESMRIAALTTEIIALNEELNSTMSVLLRLEIQSNGKSRDDDQIYADFSARAATLQQRINHLNTTRAELRGDTKEKEAGGIEEEDDLEFIAFKEFMDAMGAINVMNSLEEDE